MKKLRPEEERARRIIANHLGEVVEPHDNLSTEQRRPDLRIEYGNQPHAVVEVVRDIEKSRLQQHVEIDRINAKWQYSFLTSSWLVILDPAAHVGRLKAELGHILDDAYQRGLTEIHARQRPHGSIAFQLHEVRVLRAWLLPDRTPGTVYFTTTSSWWFGSANSVVDWAERVLERNPDVAAKLLASGYERRQAYLIATIVGETQIWGTLRAREAGRHDYFELPTRPPALPDGVDSLWIEGEGRVIAWSPETSWIAVAAEALN